jgi:phosphate starvation-inducible PhoH-like protein
MYRRYFCSTITTTGILCLLMNLLSSATPHYTPLAFTNHYSMDDKPLTVLFSKKRNHPYEDTVSRSVMDTIKPIGDQKLFVNYLRNESLPVVVCTGPAGTGKTMFACFEAVRSLKNDESPIQKIIITRPTVMADDELGFLPGEINSKMEPWTRPIFDYLYEAASSRQEVHIWLKEGLLEVLPLGYMRGRTFKNSFILGDECQNIQISTMKMLLTRLGENSKIVIVGDPDQSDLPRHVQNGLQDLMTRISRVDNINSGFGMLHLGPECIRRHPLLNAILNLYSEIKP